MNCGEGCSPPGTGGVAAPVRKRREASEAAQTGWSLTVHVDVVTLSGTDAPRLRLNKEASQHLLYGAASPPLRGGEHPFPAIDSHLRGGRSYISFKTHSPM